MEFQLSAFADEAGSRLSEQISAMKDNRIPYLEIRGVDGCNIADLPKEKAREIRRQLDAEGLSVWSLGSPYGKIKITEDFAPHLEQFKRGLELADILGTGHIRIFSFYIPAKEASLYRDKVMEHLSAFCNAAAGSGILLCHENEKGIYGDTASRCAEIHQEFPSIKAVFDPANFIQCGQDTKAAWELLFPYVEYMHVKDALSDGCVVPAGKGIGNLPFLLANYKGEVLTVEPHLSIFPGFEGLEGEQSGQNRKYIYPSGRAAFDAAVAALRECIKSSYHYHIN
ncbi:MAG: sugar phosphate isomerase/epimerase [Lachnospiraceae bacterium]|nr:sugar phosphate isomerase/epimerase [Lachnospiraceae bacterium]